jgi:hypothetical protein
MSVCHGFFLVTPPRNLHEVRRPEKERNVLSRFFSKIPIVANLGLLGPKWPKNSHFSREQRQHFVDSLQHGR